MRTAVGESMLGVRVRGVPGAGPLLRLTDGTRCGTAVGAMPVFPYISAGCAAGWLTPVEGGMVKACAGAPVGTKFQGNPERDEMDPIDGILPPLLGELGSVGMSGCEIWTGCTGRG